MNSTDWHLLLTTARDNPHAQTRLASPASELDLLAIEVELGQRLPAAYRSFLAAADGGWIGDRYIYGTAELRALLSEADSARPRILPFHPVDRHGVECLELGGAGRVMWCRSADRDASLRAGRVHSLAGRIARGDANGLEEATYVDFTDWALEALQDAARAGSLVLAAPSLN